MAKKLRLRFPRLPRLTKRQRNTSLVVVLLVVIGVLVWHFTKPAGNGAAPAPAPSPAPAPALAPAPDLTTAPTTTQQPRPEGQCPSLRDRYTLSANLDCECPPGKKRDGADSAGYNFPYCLP